MSFREKHKQTAAPKSLERCLLFQSILLHLHVGELFNISISWGLMGLMSFLDNKPH